MTTGTRRFVPFLPLRSQWGESGSSRLEGVIDFVQLVPNVLGPALQFLPLYKGDQTGKLAERSEASEPGATSKGDFPKVTDPRRREAVSLIIKIYAGRVKKVGGGRLPFGLAGNG